MITSHLEMKLLKEKKYYIAATIVCMLGIFGMAYYYFFTGFSIGSGTHYLYIDSDDNVDSVYTKLIPLGSAHGMTALRTLLRHQHYAENIHTGRYAIEPDEGVISLFRKLKSGRQQPVRLVVPESRTMEQLAGTLSRKLMPDSTAIIEALRDSARLANMGYDSCTIPSLFVPNTYEVYWDISIDQLFARMQKEHKAFWNYARMQKAQAAGLTPIEVCTLASIVDEETARNDEKPMIAGMYINRLKQHMPLQADPTVKYALRDFSLRRIYKHMLNTESLYNTYRHEGLPPGPIKIASIAGIDAVLDYVHHDYLYMCAKEDFSGRHNFARTYREHMQNATRYAKALDERGVK